MDEVICATCGKSLMNWCQCTTDEIRESLKPKPIARLETCRCGEYASVTIPRTYPKGHSGSVCSPALVK